MRKLDYLRKLLAKSKKASDLVNVDLPDGFRIRHEGMDDTVYILDVICIEGMAEITICHAYSEADSIRFVEFYYEHYYLKPRKKYIFKDDPNFSNDPDPELQAMFKEYLEDSENFFSNIR